MGWLDSLTWQWGVPTSIPPGKEAVAAHAHSFTLSCIIKSAAHSGKTGSVVRTEAVAFEQDDADADSFNPHLSKYCNHIIWCHKTTAEYKDTGMGNTSIKKMRNIAMQKAALTQSTSSFLAEFSPG